MSINKYTYGVILMMHFVHVMRFWLSNECAGQRAEEQALIKH